ncbi:hypothetical protein RV18_GL001346 [Enterococcus termitis]|nr:hypothetical protein RV18_GL001346 [Enterococcus termitis]
MKVQLQYVEKNFISSLNFNPKKQTGRKDPTSLPVHFI